MPAMKMFDTGGNPVGIFMADNPPRVGELIIGRIKSLRVLEVIHASSGGSASEMVLHLLPDGPVLIVGDEPENGCAYFIRRILLR